jgi:hypothetical protein
MQMIVPDHLPPLPCRPTPHAEYVKERIRALRLQHPGRYQNASVVRSNAMKFITNYFRKGQLTKLFFLFPVRQRRRCRWGETARLCLQRWSSVSWVSLAADDSMRRRQSLVASLLHRQDGYR